VGLQTKKTVNKVQRSAALTSDDVSGANLLLNGVMNDLSPVAPDLPPLANSLLVSIGSRLSNRTREARERDQRIQDSNDKIGAYVAEAEKETDRAEKFSLYSRDAMRQLKPGFRTKTQVPRPRSKRSPEGGTPN
jgi:hypothetical protein